MRIRFNKRAVWGAVATAASMLLAGAAQAALQDRDLDGDTVVDAFYDTDLDITWLRDANVNGLMGADSASTWADTYSFSGYTDWRLPKPDGCTSENCIGSEMGHLWYVELGNIAPGPMTNTGAFQNLQPSNYWAAGGGGRREFFEAGSGIQGNYYTWFPMYALAVRDGDVAAVPEPESLALMLAGLFVLAAATRRHPR